MDRSGAGSVFITELSEDHLGVPLIRAGDSVIIKMRDSALPVCLRRVSAVNRAGQNNKGGTALITSLTLE